MGLGLFFEIAFKVIGGLGIFLLGMKHMSEGMQAVAGDRLRKMISAVTDNRIMACLIGTLITGIVQSSSVTTVMVVGFVNSGFMTLMQSLGVILGANIGTTITAWIIALKISKYGLPLLGIAAMFFLFSKKDKMRYTALSILGVGMVFFGLEIMGDAFKIPEVKEYLRNVFSVMDATTYLGVMKCALFGCLATMIVQSSSATIGVTIVLSQQGIIGFDAAAGLVLGLNVGTTITAWLASIGTSTNAKRAAYAHIIFNVIGTLWLIPVFFLYLKGIDAIFDRVQGFMMQNEKMTDLTTAKIALVHTGFNVINTIIFLPLMGLLAKLVTWLVPEKSTQEITHLTYLDIRMLNTPALGILQSQKQLDFMAESVSSMMDQLRERLNNSQDIDLENKLFHREDILDNVQKEIFLYLSKMVSGQVPQDVTTQANMQIRLADEYESLSDYVVNVLKGAKKMENNGLALDGPALEKLMTLHDRVAAYINKVNRYMKDDSGDLLSWASTEGTAISKLMKDLRAKHLERLQNEEVSPYFSLAYTDILNFYRRMKDHALNIAEVIAGEK
jgi:phosphate:Na+ symporter